MVSKSLILLVSLTFFATAAQSQHVLVTTDVCDGIYADQAVTKCGNYDQTCCFKGELAEPKYLCKGDNFCVQQVCKDPGYVINNICGTVTEVNNVGEDQCSAST